MKKLNSYLFNSTLYKSICVCVFMLVPSIVFSALSQAASAVLLLWGALFLLRDLKHKDFLKQTGSILLVLFCIGYVITLILYAENDLVSTIHVFCWTIIEFFVLFAVSCENKPSPGSLLKEMYQINIAISIVGLLSGIASLVIFLCGITVVMPDPEGLNTYWFIGIINGRNSGIFNNAIPCANAMFVAFVAAFFNLLHSKKKNIAAHVLYFLTIIVCYAVLLTTLTRTYVYGVYLFVAVAIFWIAYRYAKERKTISFKSVALVLLAVAVSLALFMGATDIMKNGMVKLVENVPAKQIILLESDMNPDPTVPSTEPTTVPPTEPTTVPPTEPTTVPPTEPTTIPPTEPTMENTRPTLSREELEQQISDQLGLSSGITLDRNELDRLPSFLYPRDQLWKVALEVIPHSPIFGFTSGNRVSTSLQYNTGEYLKTEWVDGIPTYHNAYFDIAVSAGLLGLGLMLAFLGIQIFRTLRTLFSKDVQLANKRDKWSLGILVAYLATHVLMSSMFFGVLCFTNISVCLYFWIVMGYVSRINDMSDDGCPKLSADSIVEKMLSRRKK